MSKTSSNGRKISGRDQGPQLNIYKEIEEAGFSKGDEVTIEAGNGYIVVHRQRQTYPLARLTSKIGPT